MLEELNGESQHSQTVFPICTVLTAGSSSADCKHVFHSTTVSSWGLLVFSTTLRLDQISRTVAHKSPVVHYKAALIKWLLICPAVTHIRHTASQGISALLLYTVPQEKCEVATAQQCLEAIWKYYYFNGLPCYTNLLQPSVLQ